MWSPLILVLACVVVESRVTFDKAEVLDDVDLKGTNTAEFRCSSGCRVYSPTRNDNIVIKDASFKEYKSLMDLANLAGQPYDLPAGNYHLNRQGGLGDPVFVFYALEKAASNYNTKVVYVSAGSRVTLDAKTSELYTVISSTGAVRFSNFVGDYSAALSTVFATGFDSIASCRPVFTARGTAPTLKAAFPVNSPIATISFKSTTSGRSVVVSGDTDMTATGENTSSVYVSPGYVGCKSVGDALYTNLPRVFNIDDYIYLTNSNGLNLRLDGEYSIAKQEDALKLTVGDGPEQKLYGTNTIASSTDGTKAKVQISWQKKDNSDRFVLQVDVTTKTAPAPGAASTTKGSPGAVSTTKGPGPGPGQTSPRPAFDSTTSAVQPVAMLISSLIVVFASLFR